MIGFTTEFFSIIHYMVNKIGELVGVGKGMCDPFFGKQTGHGFIGNGKKQPMKALDLMIMFAVHNRQADNGIIQPMVCGHIAQCALTHQFRLGIVAQVRRQGKMIILGEIFPAGQSGSRTHVDIGNSQRTTGPRHVYDTQVVDLKG